MATSKALRAAPAKKLDNYVASIRHLNGAAPETISDFAFLSTDFISNGSSTTATDFSSNKPLGFNLTINGVTYNSVAISEYGWMILQAPGVTAASNQVMTAEYFNEVIYNTFTANHILLAPWFDYALVVPATIDALQSYYYNSVITNAIEEDIKSGKNTKNWPYNSIDRCARFKNIYHPKHGKCFLARWTLSQEYYGNKLKFEVAIFENGRIELRYWPLETFEPGWSAPATTSATVGIFWNGTGTSNKFRDFAPLLNYRSANTPLGGASYDASYSESSKPYSNLIPISSWPKGGGVITFSPPTNLGKILPKKLISVMSDTRQIIRSPGLYDDRKTINYVSGVAVHAPSNLPSRLIGDSGDVDVSLRQSLFVSGSDAGNSFVITNGRVNKSVVNAQLAQIEAIEKFNAPSDLSFNESQKNYESIVSTSAFYATGSSVEEFGLGFSSPLKSKTQFRLSLPVENPTNMLSLTSSFYYYDKDNKRWVSVLQEYTKPGGTFVVEDENQYSAYEEGLDNGPINRIVEGAIGFDAVGRKIVSGSFGDGYMAFDTSLNMQSDPAIGSIANTDGASQAEMVSALFKTLFSLPSKEAISRKYANSVADNPLLKPLISQKLDFNVEQPFLIEKIIVNLPIYISGDWFKDLTTCARPFMDSTARNGMNGRFRGPIDFGGPGITFAIHCHRGYLGSSYLDLIASGTITHYDDDSAGIVFKKDPGMTHYGMRPVGFRSFSNPAAVISGSNNIFDGKIKLELTPSVAGGYTFARLDRSCVTSSYATKNVVSTTLVGYNRDRAVQLLTSEKLFTRGEKTINAYDTNANVARGNQFNPVLTAAQLEAQYPNRSPRIFLQQISPLSRGATGVEFNGNSILGGNIASFNEELLIKNPLYVSVSSSLPTIYKNIIDTNNFAFEAVCVYSTVDTTPAPYLMMPGDKLTLSVSKTRPVFYKAVNATTAGYYYSNFDLTGSHGTVQLATGSIDITLFGSYVRGGVEFNP